LTEEETRWTSVGLVDLGALPAEDLSEELDRDGVGARRAASVPDPGLLLDEIDADDAWRWKTPMIRVLWR